MMSFLLYAAYLLLFAAVFLLVLQLWPTDVDAEEGNDLPSGLYRTALPFIKSLSSYTARLDVPGIKRRYARQLQAAGFSYGITPDDFLAIKLLVSLLFAVLGLMLYVSGIWRSLTPIFLGGLLGFFLPDLQLADSVRTRALKLLRALPTFLDLLTMSVEAGLELGAAIRKVTERSAAGPLTSEFKLFLKELMVGVPRRQAMLNLSSKLDLPDFTAFASAVVQADEAGASLGPILRIQTEEMRRRRFERAEKLAGQAPVKLLFPLVAFIFPATFIMIFGPLIFQFKATGGLW